MSRQDSYTRGTWGLRGAVALVAAALAGPALAQAQLDPSDTVIPVDRDSFFGLNGRYPAAEGPANLIDGLTNTKYLNFGREGSGFIVTPGTAGAVESFVLTTANDAPARDPASWALYGFNGSLTTVDSGPSPAFNPDGLAEAWTLIDSGSVSLPGDPLIGNDQRGVVGPLVNVNAGGVAYQHYKLIFPTVKDNTLANANSMQVAEVQFFADDAGTMPLLSPGNPVIAVDETQAWNFNSSHPGGEPPAAALDGNPSTKYLNFGEEGSGLIVTNSTGAFRADILTLTTANDAPDRDPASFELYGTNDPIQTLPHTDGNGGEVWTLIASGPLSLPDERGVSVDVLINATELYASYMLIFPTVKNATTANSMQIADIQLTTVPEPSGVLLGLGGTALLGLIRRRRA